MKRQFNRTIAFAAAVAYFASAGVAQADNYNFFFTKPPKKHGKNGPAISQEEESESGEEADERDEKVSEKSEEEKVEKAPVGSPAPLAASSTNPNTNTQTFTVPATQQPIIINNTNNVGYPVAAPVPVPDPKPVPLTEPAPLPTTVEPQARVSTIVLPNYKEPTRSNWRMGISSILLMTEAQKAYSSYGTLQTYDSHSNSWGALVTLGWDVTRVIGFNFFGGATYNSDFKTAHGHYGGELQLMPLRIPLAKFDLMEFGFVGGASNILAAKDNSVSLHIGGKVNVNFSQNYGMTAALRGNLGFYLFEAGFVARI